VDAHQEAQLLLLVGDREPVLDQRMPERTSMRSNSGTSWKNCST
jgi:hypothetical protein